MSPSRKPTNTVNNGGAVRSLKSLARRPGLVQSRNRNDILKIKIDHSSPPPLLKSHFTNRNIIQHKRVSPLRRVTSTPPFGYCSPAVASTQLFEQDSSPSSSTIFTTPATNFPSEALKTPSTTSTWSIPKFRRNHRLLSSPDFVNSPSVYASDEKCFSLPHIAPTTPLTFPQWGLNTASSSASEKQYKDKHRRKGSPAITRKLNLAVQLLVEVMEELDEDEEGDNAAE